MIKLFFDKTVSLIILLFILPVLVFISLVTIIIDGLPFTFSAKRVGLRGNIFYIYKFRSMSKDSNKILGKWGSFIRKTNLDELPQFINVMKGDMSIIGPRPHDVEEDSYFEKNIKNYYLRRSIKPGITGLAQIRGNRGGSDIRVIKNRVKHDLEYIENQSFLLDVKIFIKTVSLIFKPNH
tara:strand:- start:1868 stop:2407 length:540 start_codon:yes stop_codon:yes gene_type:complete